MQARSTGAALQLHRATGAALLLARARAATLLLAAACPLAAQAVEGGVGPILPGSTATLVDLPPTQPGWVLQLNHLRYRSDAQAGARIATAKLEQRTEATMVSAFYTFEPKLWGAFFSVGANLPQVSTEVSAALVTPLGTVRRTERRSGLGDITLVPAMLAWKDGPWQTSALLAVTAPVGSYDKARLANPGVNYWTWDPTLGLSYNNESSGFNAAVFAGIGINTRNKATDYRSGAQLHVDASVQQLLPLGKGYASLGLEAFWLQQLEADRGSGAALLGGLKGRSVAAGPVLGYVLPLAGKEALVAELRWLKESKVKNRLEGELFWLKLAYQF